MLSKFSTLYSSGSFGFPLYFEFYDCKRRRARENSLDRTESVSSPIRDLAPGNCLPRFDKVYSPKNLWFLPLAPSAEVIAVRPKGPELALNMAEPAELVRAKSFD